METVVVDYRNVDSEHICCCMSDQKCVESKKEWMKHNFEDGLVFRKGNVRGKVFIEYMPADHCWCPVDAPGYMFINCLWVSGKYQGQGVSKELLREAMAECRIKAKHGMVILSSGKKRSYLADKKFLEHCGFRLADTAVPYFELMYLPFDEDAPIPKFLPQAKDGSIEEKGWVLYYSRQCPFTAKFVPLAEDVAERMGVPLKVVEVDVPRDKEALDKEEDSGSIRPKDAPCPFTTYSLYYKGKFITHEIQTAAKLEKLFQGK